MRFPRWRRLAAAVAGAACVGGLGCSLQDFDELQAGLNSPQGGSSGSGGGGSAGDGGTGGTDSGGSGGTGGTSSGGTGGTSSEPPTNVVRNPNFDEGPSFWTAVGNCRVQLSSENPRSEPNCLEISNRTQNWEGPGYTLFGIAEPGQAYRVSVWVRAAADAGSFPIGLTYKSRCAEDTNDGSFTQLGGGTASAEWSEVTAPLVIPALVEGCTLVESQVYVEGPPPGTGFYIDDTIIIREP